MFQDNGRLMNVIDIPMLGVRPRTISCPEHPSMSLMSSHFPLHFAHGVLHGTKGHLLTLRGLRSRNRYGVSELSGGVNALRKLTNKEKYFL